MVGRETAKSSSAAVGGAPTPNATGEASISVGFAVTILMIGVVALAFSAILVKEANFEPATSAFLRCFIAFLILAPLALWEKGRKGWLSQRGVILSVLAGLFLGVDFVAWNYSIFYVGAGIASVLLNLQIIILPLMAVIFDKYHVPRSFLFLVPIMAVGIILTGGVFDAAPTEGPATVYGINIAVLGTVLGSTSGVCYGIYLYASRKAGVINPGRYIQPMALVSVAQLVPIVLFMVLFSSRGFDLTHGVMIGGKLPDKPETMLGDPITAINWFWIILLAISGQAMAWLFVQIGSVRLDPTIVAGLLLLSPVSTVFIAAFTHGEIPSGLQVLGVVIVLGAVAYQNNLISALMNKLRPTSGTSPAG